MDDWKRFSLRVESGVDVREEVFRLATERHWSVRELTPASSDARGCASWKSRIPTQSEPGLTFSRVVELMNAAAQPNVRTRLRNAPAWRERSTSGSSTSDARPSLLLLLSAHTRSRMNNAKILHSALSRSARLFPLADRVHRAHLFLISQRESIFTFRSPS